MPLVAGPLLGRGAASAEATAAKFTPHSESHFAIRFLLEISLRGFPFHLKVYQKCRIPKNNTNLSNLINFINLRKHTRLLRPGNRILLAGFLSNLRNLRNLRNTRSLKPGNRILQISEISEISENTRLLSSGVWNALR